MVVLYDSTGQEVVVNHQLIDCSDECTKAVPTHEIGSTSRMTKFADNTSNALARGVVPTLSVCCLAALCTERAMRFLGGGYFLVGVPEIAVRVIGVMLLGVVQRSLSERLLWELQGVCCHRIRAFWNLPEMERACVRKLAVHHATRQNSRRTHVPSLDPTHSIQQGHFQTCHNQLSSICANKANSHAWKRSETE